MANCIETTDRNAVIIANPFNLTLINSVWLYKNNIFTEEELKDGRALPNYIEIRSNQFRLTLLPDRLQFSISPEYDGAKNLLISKVGKIIEELPHTPYTAAGLNFTYHVTPEDGDIGKLGKSLFCHAGSKWCDEFDDDDARFGGYFSKNIMDSRMRMDVKPLTLKAPGTPDIEKLQFSFNFHKNISEDNACDAILAFLKEWDDAENIARNISEKINQ
jgi:hypothetical protein